MGSFFTGSNVSKIVRWHNNSSTVTPRLISDLIATCLTCSNLNIISLDSNRSLLVSVSFCSWVSPLRSKYGNARAEGKGFGHPPLMKLKNVHLPHPQPNGGFWDPSLWEEELGQGLTLAPSEVNTSSDIVLLVHKSSRLLTGVCLEVRVAGAITTCG